MSKKIQWLMAVLLLAGAAGFYVTPYLAVRDMNAAIAAQDVAKFSSHIDYPALKESLKVSLSAKLAAEIKQSKDGSPLAELSPEMTASLIGPMVEAMARPESVVMLMKGNQPQFAASANQEPPSFDDPDSSMAYESFDRFVLTVQKKGQTGKPIELVLTHENMLSWKLTAVRLAM